MNKQGKKDRLYYLDPKAKVRIWLEGGDWATLQASDFIGREGRYRWAPNENRARFFYKGVIASFIGIPADCVELPELQLCEPTTHYDI